MSGRSFLQAYASLGLQMPGKHVQILLIYQKFPRPPDPCHSSLGGASRHIVFWVHFGTAPLASFHVPEIV